MKLAPPRIRIVVGAPEDPDRKQSMKMAKAGAASIQARIAAHRDSITNTGVGIYYGSHWDMAKRMGQVKDWLRKDKLKPGAELPTLIPTNCIDWALEHLGAAYKAAGKAERWEKILEAIGARKKKGGLGREEAEDLSGKDMKVGIVGKAKKATDVARLLQEDGWEGIYFNPDVEHPKIGKSDDGKEHLHSARVAARYGTYYNLKVHHQVLNFRPTAEPPSPTELDMSGIELLRQVPFFFGLSRGGKHTYVGSYGVVSEAHWDHQPVDPGVMGEVPLEKFDWMSGLLLIPPKTWPKGAA